MNKKSELQKTMFGSTLWNIWIWLTIVLVVLADVNVVVSLGIEGVGGGHLAIPIIFLTLDVILALVAAFSNFRFRYSLVFPIIYAAFTVVMGIVGIIVYCAILDYIVFTSFALISWMIFELLSVATILLSTIRASGKGLVFSIITVVLVVIFAAYSIFYVVIVARDGFFGQGKSGSYSSEERTTTYRYDEETDTYIATGTLSGRGGTVLVADSVNGKKVGEVDCSIFLGDGITSARLLCDGDVKFSNTECIADIPADFTVTALKDNIDDFKTYFYELSVETADGAVATYDARTDALRDAYADFANRITPEVEEGEVYIVFTYGYSDLQTLGVGNVLPTWISESGDKFEMSEFLKHIEVEDSFMYENMDPSKEDNLYYYYTNYGKIILNELQDPDGNPIEGRDITAPMSVGVSYEDIYAVSISTNDTVYEGTEEFSEISDFSSSGFRYVTGSSANDLISDINNTANARAGFTYKWTYGDGKNLSSLESVIEDGMEISLEWTLDAPKIELVSSASGTYGDIITLTPTVSHADTSTIAYSYSWTSTVGNAVSAKDYTFSKALPSDSGTYTLTVTASPEDTSLTSSASASVSVSISKKTLSFAWALDGVAIGILTDEQRTYSGVYKTLSSSASGVLEDDTTFSYTQSITQMKDAGTYSFYATLDGDWGDYYALDSSVSSSLTVSPYTLAVEWNEETFTYDLESHVLSYSYTLDTLGEDSIDDTLLGASAAASAKVNAGTYTAEIVWTNGNYIIYNPTQTYTISPAELTVTAWSADSLTYCGDYQHPDVSEFTGRVDGDYDEIAFGYEYDGRDVGSDHVVIVKSLNSNYVVTEASASKNYAITAYELEVTWGTETITYNGSEQILSHEYAITSLGTDEITDTLLGVTISGYGTDAGTNAYNATIEWTNTNYTLTNTSQTYSIAQREVSVATWSGDALIYNGTAQNPVANSYNNLVLGDDLNPAYTISGGNATGKDVGSYTVTISINNGNYSLSGVTTYSYTISAYELAVNWGSESLTYDGTSQVISHGFAIASLGEDTEINDTLLGATVSGNTNAGEYTATIVWTNANYTLTNTTCGYTISPAPLTVTWVDTSLTYSGAAQRPKIESYSGNFLGESVTFTYSDEGNTNVGDYSVTAKSDDGNYTITNPNCYYTISAYTLDVTWSDETLIYNGSAQAPSHSFSAETLGGDTIDDTLLGVTVSGKETNAGDNYVASITWTNGNYALTNTSTTYSIAQKNVSVTEWDKNTFEYNGETQHPVAATYNGFVEGDDLGEKYAISTRSGGDADGISVGEYTVTISISNENYNLTGTTTYDYAITAYELAVTWGTETITYDGTAQAPSYSFAIDTLGQDTIDDDLLGVTVSGKQTNAGSGYTATIVWTNTNYTLTNTTKTYSIAQREVSVAEWDSNTFVYSGTSQNPVATSYNNLVSGDDLSPAYAISVVSDGDEAGKNVGSYTVTISINNGNYTLTGNVTYGYSITPAPLTVTGWSDTSLTYNGSAQYPTVLTYSGNIDGEEVTFTYSDCSDNINVGSYTVTATSANPNYEITSGGTGTYEITPAPLTVTGWTSTALIYSASQQYPTATFSGTFGNDVVNATYSVTNGDGVNAGSYTVTITAIGNPNYSMPTGSLSTEYSISALEVSANWGETSFVYDGSSHEVTCTVIGADGNALQVSVSISGANDATEAKDAGSYTAIVTILDATAAGNYTITNSTQEITVAKASVSVEWNDGTPSFTWNNGEDITAETAGITCTYYVQTNDETWTETDDVTEAGTYYAVLSIVDDGNYEFASGTSTYKQFEVTGD